MGIKWIGVCFGGFLALGASAVLGAELPPITDNGPVGKYAKFEVTFGIDRKYKNPFDPDEVDVTLSFRSPSGRERTVQGFYYQDYERTGDLKGQTLTPLGEPLWKARFAPDEAGTWTYQVAVKDKKGTRASGPRTFLVRDSDSKGFVRVSKKDQDYFAFDNGEPYFPLGEDMGWSSSGRTFQYDKWVRALAANGGNFIRVWQANWHTEYEWAYSYPATTLLPGNYLDRMREAWELDHILDLCREKNVYVMLCLINHGRFSTTNDSNWKDNPYNRKANPKGGFLDDPGELWTSAEAGRYIRRNWRYLVARYAHNTSLQSWELFNEMEWIDHYDRSVTASMDFHKAMGGYLRSIDPYGHLVTTSYAHALKWPAGVWDTMDFTQEHNYGGTDMAQLSANLTSGMKALVPGKPFFIGEMGIGGAGGAEDKADPTGIFIHNTNWGSLTAKAAGGGFPWWWDNYVDPGDLYFRWKGISAFLRGEDLDSRGYRPVPFPVASSGLGDLVISPGRNDWGVKAPQAQYRVLEDGTLDPSEANLTGYLYSVSKEQFRNPPTFHVEPAKACRFQVKLGTISSWGKNDLTITLDGKPTKVQRAPAVQGGLYAIEVPAGPHEVTVDSTGQDWVQVVSYGLEKFTGPLRCRALNGQGKVLGLVQVKTYNYTEPSPAQVKDGLLRLSGLAPEGVWALEWWDTVQGTVRKGTDLRVKDGRAELQLPVLDKDLAFKLVWKGKP